MRVGLFGGTFNPIHMGHVRAALKVKEEFALDKINFIPSALPPHKETKGMLDASDRCQMTRLAVESYPDFSVSDIELKRSGPSYTIDTVRYFKNKIPVSTPCYLIVGMDAFLEIDTWKTFQKLFDLIPFIVMTRPAEGIKQSAASSAELGKYIHVHVDSGYELVHQQSCFVHLAKQSVHLFHVTPIDISSTKIRNFVRQGVSIKSMVPGTVEKYIYKKGLYL